MTNMREKTARKSLDSRAPRQTIPHLLLRICSLLPILIAYLMELSLVQYLSGKSRLPHVSFTLAGEVEKFKQTPKIKNI